MSDTAKFQPYSYSVFTFVTDEMRSLSVPVGVALWGGRTDRIRVRFASEGEKIKGLRGTAYTYLRVTESQIWQWVRSGGLPYSTSAVAPDSDAWWKHVSKLLVHSIRLSEPRPIDVNDIEKEVDLLYEAVVGPERGTKKRAKRIDRILSASLGKLARKLERGTVAGFHGRPVPVQHFKEAGERIVVVEGVNLAAAAAEDDTDALVSRLQRIKEANGRPAGGMSVAAFVGYLASPHGLNGEAALVEWIREKAGAQTFDLVRERERFQGALEGVLETMES